MIRWLVVTDVDGTLMNHHDYSIDAAREGIVELKARDIPVILNTSKTYAETSVIRAELAIHDAFIVENGSCLYLPKAGFEQPQDAGSRDDYWELVLGASHSKIDEALAKLIEDESCCTRLSRCTVEEAVALTGLAPEDAEQAIAREFSEPLLWQASDDALRTLLVRLSEIGLSTLQGGRFLHVIGDCDKAKAMRALAAAYGDEVKMIALGDSPNDAAMLEAADISVAVSSPSTENLLACTTPDIQTESVAPQGWLEGIQLALAIIDE